MKCCFFSTVITTTFTSSVQLIQSCDNTHTMKLKLEGEELQKYLDELCKQNGFDYAKYLGTYKGDEIYQPSFDSDVDILFGYPVFIHVHNGKIRRSKNHKEAFTVGRYFFPKK